MHDSPSTLDNPALFRRCLAASLAVHGCLLLAGRIAPRIVPPPIPSMEIDLSMGSPEIGPGGGGFSRKAAAAGPGPGLPGGFSIQKPAQALKLAAPQALVPGIPAPGPAPEAQPPEPAKPSQPPAEWVSPGPQTQRFEKLVEPGPLPGGIAEGTGIAALTGGSGSGARIGSPDGIGAVPGSGIPGGTGTGGRGSGILRMPRLLNRDEVRANMQRLFPESERAAGHEGQVTLMLHIGADGRVEPGEVVQSAGPAFDAASKKVAKLMRFEPALGAAGPVAVKLKQAVIFHLQD